MLLLIFGFLIVRASRRGTFLARCVEGWPWALQLWSCCFQRRADGNSLILTRISRRTGNVSLFAIAVHSHNVYVAKLAIVSIKYLYFCTILFHLRTILFHLRVQNIYNPFLIKKPLHTLNYPHFFSVETLISQNIF